MSRKANVSIFAVVLTLGLVAGFLADLPASEVEPVYAAACQATNGACTGGDLTKTSALHVVHVKPITTPAPANVPVEPNTGESWNIIATWRSANVPCSSASETASVDVDWNGSSWVLSNKSTTANIVGIELCDTDEWCDDTESYGYKLKVDINDPVGAVPVRNLAQVVYTTTSVDNGNELDIEECSVGSSVTATSQTFSATDSGPFTSLAGRCPFGCVDGASVNITYR